jgi:hypothetical protein
MRIKIATGNTNSFPEPELHNNVAVLEHWLISAEIKYYLKTRSIPVRNSY